MNRFQLYSLVVILLLLTPRIQAIRRVSDKGSSQQIFHPGPSGSPSTGQAGQFEEKRRVPTGSNPLHNKR
ncbi:hypothetical protein V6N13_087477 [Hibiscus sabdariffa]|uniref:Uncharacterized protein n=1 Tax=Hibiscus sabdariffa TaxID=183260 RepID=A0ABR2FWS7_9ROSI